MKIQWLILLLITVFTLGCNHTSDESNNDSINPAPTNIIPVANAGEDSSTFESQTLQLSGTDSSDEDGTITTYGWTQVSGTPVTLENSDAVTATITTPDEPSDLVFELTVTDDAGETHSDQIMVSVSYFYEPAQNIGNLIYTPGPKVDHTTMDECSSFEDNIIRSDTVQNLKEINAENVAIMWGNSSHMSNDTQAFLTELENTDSIGRQNIISNLIELQRLLKEKYKLDVSNSRSPVDNKCYRTPFVLWETEIWQDEFNSLSGGWAACAFDSERGLPLVAIPVGAVQELASTTPIQSQLLTHEFFHTLHCTSGYRGDLNKGWEWSVESFANYLGNAISKNLVATHQFHENHHMSLNNSLKRYGIWPFWIFMNEEFGPELNVDVVIGETQGSETLFEFIRRRAPFDCENNDANCRQVAFANLYARYANSTVNLIPYYENAELDIYNKVHVWNETQTRDNAAMDKVADYSYRVAPWIAPHRYAHNIIRLIPDPNQNEIHITLNGWDIPQRESDWRATVIATLNDDSTPRVEAQGEMFEAGTQVIDIKQWESELGQSIKQLHLVVAAVPSNWIRDSELGDFFDATRSLSLDQYMYELKIKGAWPKGHEPLSLLPTPEVTGQPHSNGQGFVADTATVDASAYVGPGVQVLDNAQVLGSARIEGRALIQHDSLVQDNAIVSTYSSIDLDAQILNYATVRDNARVYRNAVVKDDAKVQGEVFLYDSFSMGGQAMAMNMPLIETTGGGGSLSGTAIMNGEGYFSEGSASMGTSRNNYTEDDLGLLLHYDFETPHPYRINDTHGNSDAFYINGQTNLGAMANFIDDATLTSQVLSFQGNGYLELPKWILDQRNYQLEFLFNWSDDNDSGTQTLISATTDNQEKLNIELTETTNGLFEIQLSIQDRDGNQITRQLQNNMLQTGTWLKLALAFNDNAKTLTLITTPQSGGESAQVTATLNYGTRAFQYTSLRVLMAGNLEKEQFFFGKIDELRLVR